MKRRLLFLIETDPRLNGEFQSRVETRLQQAGVRLADLIRQRLTVR